MADELKESTRRTLTSSVESRIRDFCKSIKVSQGLDRQIADELSAHMEDKVRAYLEGREKVTEEDALLLVEHHFGEPGVVRDLLQTVHNGLPATSIARRLGAIICLASALAGVEHLLRLALYLLFYHWLNEDAVFQIVSRHVDFAALVAQPRIYPVASNVTVLLPAVVTIVALWTVIRYWQRQINVGIRPWFNRWAGWQVAAVAVVSFIAAESTHLIPTPFWATDPALQDFTLQIYGAALILVATAGIWVWWCGLCTRKSTAAAAIGIFGWLGWEVLYRMLMPNIWRPSLFNFQWHFSPHSQTAERFPFDLAQMLALSAAVFLGYYLISKRSRSDVLATSSH